MHYISATEEDYLKAIYKIAEMQTADDFVNTNAIAARMNTRAASVTDMMKRLAEKQLLIYQKYKGVQLSEQGNALARSLVRKHRLWEVFLVDKLGYSWDAVHDIAEQMEHIHSDDLTDRLDDFLGRPTHDPHGDPIPDRHGKWQASNAQLLADLPIDSHCKVSGVKDHSTAFLHHLAAHSIQLGTVLRITDIQTYDRSVTVFLPQYGRSFVLSEQVSKHLCVRLIPHTNLKNKVL